MPLISGSFYFFWVYFIRCARGGHSSLVLLWLSFAGGSTTSATTRDFFNPREIDLRTASRHPYLQMLNLETHHSLGAGQYCPWYFGPVSSYRSSRPEEAHCAIFLHLRNYFSHPCQNPIRSRVRTSVTFLKVLSYRVLIVAFAAAFRS